MHLLQTLSSNERERIWNKAKSNAKFTTLLGSGKYLDESVPLSWPTAEFSTHPYNKDFDCQVHFHTFLDVNAWNDPEDIELPYISCMKLLIILDKGILLDITMPNPHYFLTIAFHIFEAFYQDPLPLYYIPKPYKETPIKSNQKSYWNKQKLGQNRKQRHFISWLSGKQLSGITRTSGTHTTGQSGYIPFSLLTHLYNDLIIDELLADIIPLLYNGYPCYLY